MRRHAYECPVCQSEQSVLLPGGNAGSTSSCRECRSGLEFTPDGDAVKVVPAGPAASRPSEPATASAPPAVPDDYQRYRGPPLREQPVADGTRVIALLILAASLTGLATAWGIHIMPDEYDGLQQVGITVEVANATGLLRSVFPDEVEGLQQVNITIEVANATGPLANTTLLVDGRPARHCRLQGNFSQANVNSGQFRGVAQQVHWILIKFL